MIGRKDMGCAETQIGPKTGQIMKKSSIKHCKKVSLKLEKFRFLKGGRAAGEFTS